MEPFFLSLGASLVKAYDWIAAQPSWFQITLAITGLFLFAAWAHRSEIRHEREWAEFKRYMKSHSKTLRG